LVEYAKFTEESDFLRALYQASFASVAYPRVTAIGARKVIPDIDLLEVNGRKGEETITGYELKVLKRDRRTEGVGWTSFYTGLGQTMWILQHGIDRAILALAFQTGITDELIDRFRQDLWDRREVLGRTLSGGLGCVGIRVYLYERGGLPMILEPKGKLYPQTEEARTNRQRILEGRLAYSKKLQRETPK